MIDQPLNSPPAGVVAPVIVIFLLPVVVIESALALKVNLPSGVSIEIVPPPETTSLS